MKGAIILSTADRTTENLILIQNTVLNRRKEFFNSQHSVTYKQLVQ
jgi:hypothetical protein